jgi:hypothetical protein
MSLVPVTEAMASKLTKQNFANLGGLGRADLVQLYPATNKVTRPREIFVVSSSWTP